LHHSSTAHSHSHAWSSPGLKPGHPPTKTLGHLIARTHGKSAPAELPLRTGEVRAELSASRPALHLESSQSAWPLHHWRSAKPALSAHALQRAPAVQRLEAPRHWAPHRPAPTALRTSLSQRLSALF